MTAMLSIGTVVMGVSDLARAEAFWRAALDYLPLEESRDAGWITLRPASGQGTRLSLELSESTVLHHPRLHLDLYAGDRAEQGRQVERLVSLGAVRIDWDSYPEDPDFVVLADTEGNLFCVIDTAHQ
jgi:catechol 2,3-dioxygenase-like lactoylglutathione lyase family enzyme